MSEKSEKKELKGIFTRTSNFTHVRRRKQPVEIISGTSWLTSLDWLHRGCAKISRRSVDGITGVTRGQSWESLSESVMTLLPHCSNTWREEDRWKHSAANSLYAGETNECYVLLQAESCKRHRLYPILLRSVDGFSAGGPRELLPSPLTASIPPFTTLLQCDRQLGKCVKGFSFIKKPVIKRKTQPEATLAYLNDLRADFDVPKWNFAAPIVWIG